MRKTGRALYSLAVAALLLALCLGLSGCAEKDSEAGNYVCVELWSGNVPLESAESSLNLLDYGLGQWSLDGETSNLRWSRSGERLRIQAGEASYAGTIGDGIIRLSGPDGLKLVYAREELAASYREEQTAYWETLGLWQDAWLGGWYGWWRIENSEGALEDTWYDLCAYVVSQPDGKLFLTLWDEDTSREEPLGEAVFTRGEDGAAVLAEGWFSDPHG